MPRHFFNVHDGHFIRDDVGVELPDLDAARALAVRASGEAIRDLGAKFWAAEGWQMDVTNEQGALLFTLYFSSSRPALAQHLA